MGNKPGSPAQAPADSKGRGAGESSQKLVVVKPASPVSEAGGEGGGPTRTASSASDDGGAPDAV